ncbi:uncharacterized protein [Typha angustifolia]|uniref:uncharacterized protein n=1 Tax=Typha angustifolia TaxID=59011 RepID=UPI003C307225
MSGLSLAVAPRSDPDQTAADEKQQTLMGGVMGSLRVIEIQLVAFIMVFSASGLVPLLDLLFPVFATLYALLLSRLAFPSPSGSHGREEIFHAAGGVGKHGLFFRAYVVLGTTVGLFLPLAYVLGGFARGDDHAVRSTTPHLFLLSCQILTENVISGLGVFSPPVRAIVPLLYTVRRTFVIVDWVLDVCMNKTLPPSALIQDAAWLWFGRVLAVANLIYFSVNLFGFLIPQFLPRAFEKYFKMRDEAHAKTSQDKNADTSAAQTAESRKPDEAKKAD